MPGLNRCSVRVCTGRFNSSRTANDGVERARGGRGGPGVAHQLAVLDPDVSANRVFAHAGFDFQSVFGSAHGR